MKMKQFLLSLTLLSMTCSCVYYDESRRRTHPGRVAFDYTYNVLEKYATMLEYAYRFNEYYSQTDLAKRDSVDKLYFNNVKILRGEEENTWTLRHLSEDKMHMSIRTNGHNLNAPGTWTVRDLSSSSAKQRIIYEFEIKNEDRNTWSVARHDNRDREFEYSCSWKIHFGKSASRKIEGEGTLLSIQSPKLQLDYTIEVPLRIEKTRGEAGFMDGIIKILATDVREKRTEETKACITSHDNVEIRYLNSREHWMYNGRLRF